MKGRLWDAVGKGASVEGGGAPGDGRAEEVAGVGGGVEGPTRAGVRAIGHLEVGVRASSIRVCVDNGQRDRLRHRRR